MKPARPCNAARVLSLQLIGIQLPTQRQQPGKGGATKDPDFMGLGWIGGRRGHPSKYRTSKAFFTSKNLVITDPCLR